MNKDICEIISNYIYVNYSLLDWIDINNLKWDYLSSNPNAIELLKENQDKINWGHISKNSSIFKIYNKNDIELIQKTLEIILT